MKTLLIDHTMQGLDELFESDIVKKLFAPYQAGERSNRKRILESICENPDSVRAYVVKRNPEHNYGRDFDIYYLFTSKEEGINFLNKLEVSSMLSNAPLQRVIVNETGELEFTDDFYANTRNNRKLIAKSGMTVGKF